MTGKMPKHSRPPCRMSEHKSNSWSKQPRPLENGNWVCDDPQCGNVNYPRRTECFRCRKRRGPVGDAVVKAFIEKSKLVKGEVQQNKVMHPMQMMTSPGAPMNKIDPWLGTGLEHMRLESPHYDADRSYFSRNLSAATEGKRLAEHLLACFSASSDPIGDAGECLASAVVWLQVMKMRLYPSEEQTLSTSSMVSIGSSAFGNLCMGVNSSINMLSQSQYTTKFVPGMVLGMANGVSQPNATTNECPGSRSAHSNLKWEDYKDRPSDFLKEFGDPAAASAATFGGGLKPEPGVNGNWECEECKNVNFPRRTCCFQCRKKRGAKGDDLVRKYVRGLFNCGDTIWAM